MRKMIMVVSALLLPAVSPLMASDVNTPFDWAQWNYLPVLEGGRQKPLDTLAWETLRTLCNRGSFAEPDTGQKLDPTTFYLAILFDWQGWDQPESLSAYGSAGARMAYFKLHQPDKWDQAPLLRVDFLPLREALGMEPDQKYISPLEVSRAQIQLPDSEQETPFVLWAEKQVRARQQQQRPEFTPFERKAIELADKFWAYQDHRMGNRLQVIPVQGSATSEWISVASLMTVKLDDTSDPTGKMRQAQQQFSAARAAFFDSDAERFNAASSSFISTAGALGPQLGDYPRAGAMGLEVTYNRWAPFRFAWVFALLAFVGLLLSSGSGWKSLYIGSVAVFVLALVAMLTGFAMRVMISGRAPVTNMYESVIYLGLGVAVFGFIFELMYRKKFILTAAAGVATIALLLADNCPAILDPSVRPLQPVLRSNFWLITHVLTITLSYAAFALALGIGNITLGYYLARSRNRETINALSKFTYRAVQVGVLLLAAGTILGGVWADYAWGRFWGWDPKEVWALIALLGYLAVLHARYVGWVRQFGLAALSVICFSLVVMAWYGVNFVLGAGLHSYGFGGGGLSYVVAALALQLLYVIVSAVWSAPIRAEQREKAAARSETATATLPGQEPTAA
jgi:cytochrome c-type biogenesis protein CcsB